MKPNYGNWISVSMMKTLCAIAAVLYVLTLGCALFVIAFGQLHRTSGIS